MKKVEPKSRHEQAIVFKNNIIHMIALSVMRGRREAKELKNQPVDHNEDVLI